MDRLKRQIGAFEIDRAEVAEGRVHPLPVVVNLNVFEDVASGDRAQRKVSVVNEFGLECAEEALARCIVEAIALSTHARQRFNLVKTSAVSVTRVLAATIGMVDEPRRGWMLRNRHIQRVDGNVGGEPSAHRPADDAASEEIDYDG